MINFFRKIRQGLLTENKFSRYFMYAVGEIVLVVIGILIALQINNWNELRKLRLQEKKFLVSLKDDLNRDIKSLDKFIEDRSKKVESADKLLLPLDLSTPGKLLELDSLISQVLGWIRFMPHTNTMDELISSGNLSILSNDSIKHVILSLKEDHQHDEIYTEHMRHEYDKYLYDPHSMLREGGLFVDREASLAADSLVRRQPSEEELVRIGSETAAFLSNKQVRNGLKLASRNNYGLVRVYKRMKLKTQDLIRLIDEELQRH